MVRLTEQMHLVTEILSGLCICLQFQLLLHFQDDFRQCDKMTQIQLGEILLHLPFGTYGINWLIQTSGKPVSSHTYTLQSSSAHSTRISASKNFPFIL